MLNVAVCGIIVCSGRVGCWLLVASPAVPSVVALCRAPLKLTMRIEVAAPNGVATKVKGDLLEKFAAEFLRTQLFEVTEQVRDGCGA